MSVPQKTTTLTDKEAEQFLAENRRIRTELATAIGFFCIEFVALEATVDATIHALLRLEPATGKALTSAILNVSTKLDILGSLVRDLRIAKKRREAISKALDETIELNAFRNWLLHDSWGGSTWTSVDPVVRHSKFRMRPKGGGRGWQNRSFTNAEIHAQAAKCQEVARALLVDALVPLSRAARKKRKKAGQEKTGIVSVTVKG